MRWACLSATPAAPSGRRSSPAVFFCCLPRFRPPVARLRGLFLAMTIQRICLLLPLAVLAVAAHFARGQSGGPTLVFALAAGSVFGLVLQRTRFCFYCHARDWFEGGDPRGLLAIVLALAVGLAGYTVVLGGWLPDPSGGTLPPDAHIGPVSWVLVAAGLAFGGGMVISGSCISAHWYRLAEGSPTSPFA